MSLMHTLYANSDTFGKKTIGTDCDMVLKEADGTTAIIEVGGEYAGFIQHFPLHERLPEVVYIPDMEILCDKRGRGSGSRALDLFEKYEKENGNKAIIVEDANKGKNTETLRGRSFWEKGGYRSFELLDGPVHGKPLEEGYDIQAQLDGAFNG